MPEQEQLRILVVDDEATQRILAKDYLEGAGHIVRPVEDGARAIKMAERSKPDIILLDVLLPHVDGFSICEQLKKSPKTSGTPIILITASREPDVIEKGLNAGADDFVTKPVDWEFLADRVVNVVKRARERADMERLISSQMNASAAEVVTRHDADGIDDQLEALMQSSDLQAELANEAIEAERERLLAEATETIAQEVAKARSEAAEEIARLKQQHASEIERANNSVRTEYVSQINALKQEHKKQLESYVEQVLSARQSEIDALNNENASELQELRNRYAVEVEAIREAAKQDIAIAEQRHVAELKSLKKSLEDEAVVRHEEFAKLREAATCHVDTRVQAGWRMVQNWSNTQQSLARAITEKAKTAGDNSLLRDIGRTATALSHSLGKMKILSEALSASSELAETPVQLADLVANVARETESMARERRVNVHVQQIDPDIYLQTDMKRIRYVLISLLVNAIRFTPTDGRVELKVRTDENGSTVFDITDSGVGIAPSKVTELLGCLEEPCSNIGANPSDGTGFGWPIAMALTRRMGGKLDLESRLGMGSRVSVVFPTEKHVQATENNSITATM